MHSHRDIQVLIVWRKPRAVSSAVDPSVPLTSHVPRPKRTNKVATVSTCFWFIIKYCQMNLRWFYVLRCFKLSEPSISSAWLESLMCWYIWTFLAMHNPIILIALTSWSPLPYKQQSFKGSLLAHLVSVGGVFPFSCTFDTLNHNILTVHVHKCPQ